MEEIKQKLQSVLSPKRFAHSIGVMESAVRLAERYGEDRNKAALAGLLHDCARDIRGDRVFDFCRRYQVEVDPVSRLQPELLHGPLGARMAATEWGIADEQVLKAIEVHTNGCPGMDLLAKIIFIADYVEPGRSFPGVDQLRDRVMQDLDGAIVQAIDGTVQYVLSQGNLLHPGIVHTRNWILFDRKEGSG